MLIQMATDYGAQSFSFSTVGENRRQCVCKGRNDDSLKLASLLVRVFEEDKCNFLRLDRESFEWKFLRDDEKSLPPEQKKTVGEFVAGRNGLTEIKTGDRKGRPSEISDSSA